VKERKPAVLFELREYHCKPGMRDAWVRFMEEVVIPFQTSKGMVIVASFIGEAADDLYIWIRRFENEEHRARLYQAVYESETWKNEMSPRVPDMLDRTKTVVTRLNPTAMSVIR
jgi:hypothetical protein